ncbi:DedA family inner membrane protein YohD [Klebsiella pneumoniae]|nr:DedA family inner membrane protein YohD [Klebsiella pneumoniae]
MDINHLISQYGYAALIVGSMAEGETITLLGGVAAHQGLLKFPLVVIAVALGGMIGDQLLYLVGRRFGGRILRRFASQKARIRKAQRMIQHRPWLFVHRHPLYVWLPGNRPPADRRQPPAAAHFPAAEYCRSAGVGPCCLPPLAISAARWLARGCIIWTPI